MVNERLLFCVVIVFAAFALALVVHEVGHLIGGWLVGFRFSFVTVGPLKIAREGGKIRLGFLNARSLPPGMAASRPTDSRDLRRRMVIMIAGGPAASLLLALLSLEGILLLGHTWLGIESLATTIYSFVFFILTIVPCHSRGMASDGAQLLVLARGGAAAERHCAIAALAGMSVAGTRGRDLPAELVKAATGLPDGSGRDAVGAMLAYYWSLDREEIAGAGGYLDRALAAREKYPVVSRPALYREAAYFFARHRGDAPAARAFLKESTGGLMVRRHNVLRAEAAVLLAEGNYEASLQRASEGLATLLRPDGAYPNSDGVDLLQEIASLAANGLAPIGVTAERGMPADRPMGAPETAAAGARS
jgi:hypothetical protein